ncbi:putative KOM [Hibiscus syriacus]|uniref:KOM n=1 Tax=Hibiscus syriacus TaxID=106335 RepID=A0A6A2XJ62_HIBSY|nr:putative KOM [Hibiscus syriacus]
MDGYESRRLGLEGNQIKFWFQNRRTQMKTQFERHENVILRQENDKLRAENDLLKQATTTPVCDGCGGPTVPGEISYEQHRLRIENTRLKDELSRTRALSNKFLDSPVSSQGLNSNLELGVGRNGFSGLNNAGTTSPMGFEYGDGAMMPLVKPVVNEMRYDKSAFLDVALLATDELIKMAQTDNPLWINGLDGGIESLNTEEYRRTVSSSIGMKPTGCVTEATRSWLSSCRGTDGCARTIDVLSGGTGGTRDNELLVMEAEFQVFSPLVPVRLVRFTRFCKQHSEGVWAVVDVSVDLSQGAAYMQKFPNCRRLPFGCLIQDVDDNLHGSNTRSTMTVLFTISYGHYSVLVSGSVRTGGLQLSKGSVTTCIHKWDKLSVGNVGEDVRVMTRKNINDPGEPHGVVLCAATSVWMPITRARLFDFLLDEQMRSEWDILSHEITDFSHSNYLLGCGVPLQTINANEKNMLILQETWSDACGALVVYAPVDISSMSVVMNGCDSAYMALLPSGFAILLYTSPSYHGGRSDSNGPLVKNEFDGSISGGCLLHRISDYGEQLPTAKLTAESVESVSNLISCTIQKIKASVAGTLPGATK